MKEYCIIDMSTSVYKNMSEPKAITETKKYLYKQHPEYEDVSHNQISVLNPNDTYIIRISFEADDDDMCARSPRVFVDTIYELRIQTQYEYSSEALVELFKQAFPGTCVDIHEVHISCRELKR